MLHPNRVSSIEGSPAWLYIQGFQVRWHLKILKSLKKEVETLTQCSGGSLIHHPDTFFQGEISKQKSLKGLFVRNSLKTGGREGGASAMTWRCCGWRCCCSSLASPSTVQMSTAVKEALGIAQVLLSSLIPEAILECHLLAFFLLSTLEMNCCVVTSQAWKERGKVDLFCPFQWMSFLFFLVKGCPEALWKVQLCKGALVMWDWEKGCRCQKKRWEWMWVKETRKK